MKDAYALIVEAIDDGIYKPGDRLVESELAERFGVSRTPVREALQRLETQSMVKRDGKWVIASFHTSSDIFDNPILDMSKKAARYTAAATAAVGLAVGAALGWFLRRR